MNNASFSEIAVASIDKRAALRNDIAVIKNVSSKYEKDLNNAKRLVSNENIVALLVAANVSATCFETIQLNAINKHNHILDYLTRNAKLNEYISEIFVSAYRQQFNNRDAVFTKSQAKNCLDRNAIKSVSDEEREYMTFFYKFIEMSTINAQHKSTLDALCALNIFAFTSTHAHRDAYRVNFDNELTTRFAQKLNVVIEATNDDASE